MTVDAELGIAYLPVEIPTGDYYGGHRPGDNLFAESLVAVDVETGERIWHFQFVHHPIWDYDVPVHADPGRHHGRRPRDQGGRPADQAGVGLRLRPRHRRAGLAHRGAPRAARRHPRRVVLAHPAVPHEATAVRAAGVRAGGGHRSDSGTRGRGAPDRPAVPVRPHLHAAHHARRRGQARDAVRPERRQLAGRLVRPRDRHSVPLLPHPQPRPRDAQRPGALRHGLHQRPCGRTGHDGAGACR